MSCSSGSGSAASRAARPAASRAASGAGSRSRSPSPATRAALFLDEPTAGLDVESRRAVWHEMRPVLRPTAATVLLTTHYLEEAEALASRIVLLARGRVVAEGRRARSSPTGPGARASKTRFSR